MSGALLTVLLRSPCRDNQVAGTDSSRASDTLYGRQERFRRPLIFAVKSMSELLPGRPVEIAANVRRLVAPNSGPMTGPGTNTYLFGRHRSVVLDPGPALPAHVQAILEATGGHISHVLVTHTHRDHSPAAAELAVSAGARLVGLAPPQHPHQDQSFVPDEEPADGQLLEFADGMDDEMDAVRLRAIHTPGHASNHVCYLLEAEQMLFTGDHVMQGATVVIPPPDGDMAAYIASLRKVQALPLASIAPGHGVVMDDPERALRRLIRHRLQREARVLDRLGKMGSATVTGLLPLVYADVPQALWPVAEFSLRAHLIKLANEGRVAVEDELWRVLR